MKDKLILLVVFFSLCSFDTGLTKLEQLIVKAKTPEQILTIKQLFYETNLETFKDLPIGINPLNPERLKRVSSSFGERFHPISGQKKKHLGLDISAHENLAVHVTANGEIERIVFSEKGYGNYVLVKHKYGFKTRYAHLNIITVKKGQQVVQGDIIGGVGTTGSSTGNHLHYEIIKNNIHINPEKLIEK